MSGPENGAHGELTLSYGIPGRGMRLFLLLLGLGACTEYEFLTKNDATGDDDEEDEEDEESTETPIDPSAYPDDEGAMALNECSTESSTVGTFDPEVEWHWQGWSGNLSYSQVAVTPIVTHLTDDNGDGLYNESDVPTVVIEAMTSSPAGGYGGVMVALRGTDGAELWFYSNNNEINSVTPPAAADLDGDGDIELVVGLANGGLAIFDHRGRKVTQTRQSPSTGGSSTPVPAIADLDGDGVPEIIAGRNVYDNNLNLRWSKTSGGEGLNFWVSIAAVADVNGDGRPDVVAGNTAYDRNGNVIWTASGVPDGFPAIGDFDGDGDAEVVLVSGGRVYLLNGNNGSRVWGPVSVDGNGGPPTVADVDGDGAPEIGVAGQSWFWCIETNGTVKWRDSRQDLTSSATGSSVFDFEGDGSAELAYTDELRLRIYDGATGAIRYEIANPNGTAWENPTIVDVDHDGNAEVLIVGSTFVGAGATGVRSIGDRNDSWVPTRGIWNQHTYHVNNIEDDGSVPTVEVDSWTTHNTYRLNALSGATTTSLTFPDLVVMDVDTDRDACPRDLGVEVQVGNQGLLYVSAGVAVSLYKGTRLRADDLLGTVYTTVDLGSLMFEWVHFDVRSADLGSETVLTAVVDDQGMSVGVETECSEDNNGRDEEPRVCE